MLLSLLVVSLCSVEPIDAGNHAQLLGWSKDGRSFAWKRVVSTSRPKRTYTRVVKGKKATVKDPRTLPDAERAALKFTEPQVEGDAPVEMEDTERATLAVVYDVLHGSTQTVLLDDQELAYEGGHALADKYGKAGDAGPFEAWKAGPSGKPSRAGPNGTKATLKADGADDFKWKGETASWSTEGDVTMTFSVGPRDSQKLELTQGMAAMFIPKYSANIWWDPTGRRAALALERADAHTMRGEDSGTVQLFFLAAGTTVELLASAKLKGSVDKAADAVESAGFAVLSRGEAQKERPASVVFCDAAHEEAAKKIAAEIPGGASVDKLSWKANADIVVALGDSAK